MYHTMLSPRVRAKLWLRLGIRAALTVLGILAVWKLVPPLLGLFMPFVLAFLAAGLLNPLVRKLQKWLGWSRRLLSMIVVLVLFALVGVGLGLLVRAAALEVVSLMDNRDALMDTVRELVAQADAFLAELVAQLPIELETPDQTLLDRLLTLLLEWGQEAASDLGGLTAFARDQAMHISSFVLALVMFLMGSYFLTADYPYLRARFAQHMDEGVLSFLRQVRTVALSAFGGYLKAQLLLSAGVFAILLAGFLLVRQSYALLLAFALAVLDFIPIVGSGTVMVPWAVVALFSRDFSTAVSVMVIWGIVVLFRRVAEPKFVGNQTGLSPILSLISIYVGMQVAGIPGMILGPIVTLVALNLLGLGVLDGVKADLFMAVEDIRAILADRGSPS